MDLAQKGTLRGRNHCTHMSHGISRLRLYASGSALDIFDSLVVQVHCIQVTR